MLPVREEDTGRGFSFFFLPEVIKFDVTRTGPLATVVVVSPHCFPSADKSPLRCMIVFKSSILFADEAAAIEVCF